MYVLIADSLVGVTGQLEGVVRVFPWCEFGALDSAFSRHQAQWPEPFPAEPSHPQPGLRYSALR